MLKMNVVIGALCALSVVYASCPNKCNSQGVCDKFSRFVQHSCSVTDDVEKENAIVLLILHKSIRVWIIRLFDCGGCLSLLFSFSTIHSNSFYL